MAKKQKAKKDNVLQLGPQIYTGKRILVTHTDLDGIGCAVIYNKCYPHVETYFVNYDDVNEVVMGILTKEDPATPIMISDMSVNEDVAALLDERGHVELIDHHPTANWLAEKYGWALVDTTYSGTYWMFKVMSPVFELGDYQEFVALVDNYDTWGHGTEPVQQSKDLSRLAHLMGEERFLTRFVQVANVQLSPVEEAIVMMDKEKELKYIKESIDMTEVLTDAKGTSYGLLAADQYVSVLGNELLKAIPHIEYVIMIDFRKDKGSLRGRGNVDLSVMAKELGGGGHKRAAGFPLSQSVSKMFLNCGGVCEYTQRLLDKIKILEG